MNNKKTKTYLAALLPFVLLLLFFEILPLFMVVVRSFMPQGEVGFTLEHYISLFNKRLYQ